MRSRRVFGKWVRAWFAADVGWCQHTLAIPDLMPFLRLLEELLAQGKGSAQMHLDFDADAVAAHRPRYNVAPSQEHWVVKATSSTWRVQTLRWGFTRPKGSGMMVNARSETAATLPSFRESFAHSRVVVIADGFYEWKNAGTKQAQPYHVRPANGAPMWVAGLARGATFLLLTTPASAQLEPIHHRMPALLSTEDLQKWLNPDLATDELMRLLVPWTKSAMTSHPVSKRVNAVANDSAELLECVEPAQRELF
jgi:putative SOS response-associated peptidase YedK